MDDVDFAVLMKLARSGDEIAIRQVVREFEDDVRKVVRARLPRALRSQFDSMDFVQKVWGSFWAGDSDPTQVFDNRRHLRGYLAGMVGNKVLAEYHRQTRTEKYDLTREEPLYLRKGDRTTPREIPSKDPSPSQAALVEDRIDELTAGRDGVDRDIVRLRSEGLTHREIASQVKRDERTVRRVLEAVQQRWEARK